MTDSLQWEKEDLYTTGDEYFAGLLRALSSARTSVEMESYIFERGLLAERIVASLVECASRGVDVRLIVDGLGSPGFVDDYWPRLRSAGARVRFFRVVPWILRRLPGDPESVWHRLLLRFRQMNRGNHRKFCLIDRTVLWTGSFNVSDVHLREVHGEAAWKDTGVCVVGRDVRYAHRAFKRAWRGWTALNWPARSPKLLLLNDSFLHKRRTRLAHVTRIREARSRVWLATPYFVPVGHIYRLLARRAKEGLDVRLIIPFKNDVWIMKWMSVPLLKGLHKRGVKIFIYSPRFSHQKLFVADDWISIGSTNLNHRSFLHDLEMDVVITHESNKNRILQGYAGDERLSEPFDSSSWAHLPLWKRWVSSAFMILKYWS